jgi:hypothetical protein
MNGASSDGVHTAGIWEGSGRRGAADAGKKSVCRRGKDAVDDRAELAVEEEQSRKPKGEGAEYPMLKVDFSN